MKQILTYTKALVFVGITLIYLFSAVDSYSQCGPPTLNVTTTGVSVNHQGTAGAVVTGGVGNISYQWSTTETTQSITGLPVGVYNVTVTDDVVAGCTVTETITISETACDPEVPVLLLIYPQTLIAYGIIKLRYGMESAAGI